MRGSFKRQAVVTSILVVAFLGTAFVLKYRRFNRLPREAQPQPIYLKQGDELRRTLIQNPSLVSETNPEGKTVLSQVFLYRKPSAEDIATLLNAGADPNAEDDYGTTALHLAAISSSAGIIQELIAGGANLNKKDYRGRTPLKEAILFSNRPAAEALIGAGASVDVFSAAALGKLDDFRGLLRSDHSLLNTVDEDDYSPLDWAAIKQEHAVLKYIAKLHPDVDIFQAAALGDDHRIDQLLAVNQRLIASADRHKMTALDWAVVAGNYETAEHLIEKGADPNSPEPALQRAVQTGNIQMVRLLLRHKADPNVPVRGFGTLYRLAMSMHLLEIADVLKEHMGSLGHS